MIAGQTYIEITQTKDLVNSFSEQMDNLESQLDKIYYGMKNGKMTDSKDDYLVEAFKNHLYQARDEKAELNKSYTDYTYQLSEYNKIIQKCNKGLKTERKDQIAKKNKCTEQIKEIDAHIKTK